MGGPAIGMRRANSGGRPVVAPDMSERDFDFWAGVWECTWEGGRGKNTVEWICGGRVLRESFDASQHGLIGTSISVHDGAAGRWVQTWMDSEGSWFHLDGMMRDGAMELVTTAPDAEGYRKRMRFADIQRDSLRWTWSRALDGSVWEPLWEIDYRRAS
jgi:hypothetical protein